MRSSTKEKGKEGEELAVTFLVEKGFEIIERNYRYGKGELDIIAREKGFLVFVEVKSRESLEYGLPEEAITKRKMSQIRKIAEAYLAEKNITDENIRFDVVAILFLKGEISIEHYENAF
ncbi:MAG: YraN family protein [Ignavibacteriaceae bacterium]|nr:YraN family protein [Ignavibacteriaceae bacterium]